MSVRLTGAKAKFSAADAEKLRIKQVTGQYDLLSLSPVPQHQHRAGRGSDQRDCAQAGRIFSLNQIGGANQVQRLHRGLHHQGRQIPQGPRRWRIAECDNHVQRHVLRRAQGHRAQATRSLHRPLPAGREATVAWPSLDLKFQNDTKYGVLVQAYIVKGTPSSRGSITVRMWSTKTYDKVAATDPIKSNFTTGREIKDDSKDCEPTSPVRGFDVRYQRLFYQDGSVVRRENFSWR